MNFFSRLENWEVWAILISALILGTHFGRKIDFENMWKPDSATPVHMGGAIGNYGSLKNVTVVDIPPYVLESLQQDTQFKRYLTGNHKYILTFTYPGCPYSRAYQHALKQLFTNYGFAEYYRKRIVTVGKTTSVACPGHQDMKCATAWIFEHCFGGLCLINPQRKQAVVDRSQNPHQLGDLLDKYREW